MKENSEEVTSELYLEGCLEASMQVLPYKEPSVYSGTKVKNKTNIETNIFRKENTKYSINC